VEYEVGAVAFVDDLDAELVEAAAVRERSTTTPFVSRCAK
jgi:hypothetical protein